MSINVDEKTGSIALIQAFFDSGQAVLKQSGESLLKKFIPKYIGVLTNKQFKEYVSEIIIEGHTDSEGDYLYNLELLQESIVGVFLLSECKECGFIRK